MNEEKALVNYLMQLGDNSLIMGQRLAEWCGHGPVLEQDIALANIALDFVGQARTLLTLCGEVEGEGRDEDKLAFFRNDTEYRNALIVELPNYHFGFTILKQYFFDQYQLLVYSALEQNSIREELRAFAEKSLKEVKYHVRHSREWLLRLGDGTEESHEKMQEALNELWMYTEDLFAAPAGYELLVKNKIAPDLSSLQDAWKRQVLLDLEEATLTPPNTLGFMMSGSQEGHHTEYLGYILAEMQSLPRAMPEAKW